MPDQPTTLSGDAICFGLNRTTDERSLRIFLKLFSDEELLEHLIPKLAEAEISDLVHRLTGILRNHLTEAEYHRLFLKQ